MTRSAHCCSLVLIGAVSLALTACGSPEPDPRAAAAETPAAPVAPVAPAEGAADTQSPEAWSEQARQAAAASTPEDMAAEGAAAGRAMAETCGFTPADMERFKSLGGSGPQGAAFEARVEQHLPRLREAQQAQKRADAAAYQGNCESLRFMMDNRG